MSLHEFAKDLAHLEYVLPLLERGNPLSLPYWRQRVTALEAQQTLLPDGTKRVARLLKLFNEFERTGTGRRRDGG
ncbi:hypothetical protein R69927_06960 [Paraburkholderia domus]|jgi:hypothetical protein|uniref:Uncharacterized protein n=1 Tax=Paraburkholderia domus TaxID=2793075 RepID=A0A9N8MK97_9BURK|nr:hypothetical protein [Paraburkholderia domus]MBK5053653.1 hypothetical protein [Burkholderia sp. R-70006]MBK5064935.1 hypothetical protein [Burkholderia sp. R-70199]MBK5091094.1 hypothetical protein [Burkholderia sp. R-69927]MBK5125058.1 hypothetical protein [Burkholderia sp. R-69980]MBK5168564.1 hypothetical protein [Burkholderia sp. R-70211]MBK5183873.1 hypothetical protein [Burkholderia sp. R-69749]MCI0144294.1 hypothetical protein [Paraburkholderia sediminicola]